MNLLAGKAVYNRPGQRPWLQGVTILLTLLAGRATSGQTSTAAAPGVLTFRAGVDRVTISAVVRDHKGKLVTDLTQSDFEVLDNGERRPITDFRPERAAVSVALLFDVSGSMQVAAKIDSARLAARQVLAWLQAGRDELAIYSFDTALHQLEPFTLYQEDAKLERSLFGIAPFGMTSLNDAISATAQDLAARPTSHRAVIVLTDGRDNHSQLSPAEVSGIASSIDVPVYIMAVLSPLDHVGATTAVNTESPVPVGDLADLARWTGGEFFATSATAQTSLAARQIVDELRHQYLIAFAPTSRSGWHPLEVRARGRQLAVRARGGYMVGQPQTDRFEAVNREQ
jgi:Ca-activated chloride channel homolog